MPIEEDPMIESCHGLIHRVVGFLILHYDNPVDGLFDQLLGLNHE